MLWEKILGFSTTKNSSQEIIEGIFGEEIWEVFLVIRAFFFINRGRDFWIFHHQIFPKVIEGIFGEEICEGVLVVRSTTRKPSQI